MERVIVSGLPRSGTSLMMRMLAAGGLPVHQDGVRAADANNPRGYYELEAVKRLPDEPDALAGYGDGAVKVIFALAYHLPKADSYALILMQRPVSEVAASQRRMLERRGAPPDGLGADALRRALEDFRRWASGQSHLRLLEVAYHAVLGSPRAESARIAEFLGRDLNINAMAEVVEPALWRERT